MVRVVTRPWPVSMSRAAIGVCDQGSSSSAANSPGWFCLTVKTNRAPRSWRYWAWARWVWSASYEDLRVMPRCCLETRLAAASLDGTSA
jgi:hypothetical protein